MALRIKSDVDLKQMAKKYELLYCQDWSVPYEDDMYGYIIGENDDFSICWRDDSKYYTKGKINTKLTEETENLLYDLIKDGLIEKVDQC